MTRLPVEAFDQGFDKRTRRVPDRSYSARLRAALDIRPIQDVRPALVYENAERRCCENKSCDPQDVHVSPPLVLWMGSVIPIKF